jgi:hypothetical protein
VKLKVIIGEIKNKKNVELDKYSTSFKSNFKPSAKGCKKPKIPSILGPLLRCILLKTLRSSNVKKAIPNSIKITELNVANVNPI